ncbi:cyclase family protein [Auritidibacter ignavus]|uniref:Cyclase family protein n=1 Tax=Auritidibacter ignavus TaxID=678932 RepID=A0AAJ6DBY2_9MICC|nr:cyclase family protein [Auritidibacter ignavus]WGH92202.1 cyclase family protein [Auritidibacter ignavus]
MNDSQRPPVQGSLIDALVRAQATGTVEIIDLTNELSADIAVLRLPAPYINLHDFSLEPVAAFDERAPLWAHHNFRMGEHVGTHVDAPAHWITGRDGKHIHELAPTRLIGPAVVLDFVAEARADADWCLEIADVQQWERTYGPLPPNCWVLLRTGWDAYARDPEKSLNADQHGPHTPGVSPAAAEWLSQREEVSGFGVETVGIDAGLAAGFEPAFPVHHYLLGADKYGVTSLQNLDQLPPTGALIVVAPLPIKNGTAAPARVFAIVERPGAVAGQHPASPSSSDGDRR